MEDITGVNSLKFLEENKNYKFASSYIMMPRISFNTSCEQICELEASNIYTNFDIFKILVLLNTFETYMLNCRLLLR